MLHSLRAWFHAPILINLKGIAMQLAELLAEIQGLQAQVEKARTEVTDKITALEEAVANATVPQEVQDAVTNLRTAVQALDDMHPDTVVERVQNEGVQP